MDWFKNVTGMEQKEEAVPVVMDEMPAPERPDDFVMSRDSEVASLKIVKPVKYDEIMAESKDLTLEQHEFHDGLVVSLQKPIVDPVGTPPPPYGNGHHKNYQAQLTQKYTLGNPKSSSAQFGVQATFKPDRSDAVICNYNTQSGHSGILARSFGPVDTVMQWMQTPFGMTGLYAHADLKSDASVTGLTYVRNQMWSLSHVHSLWRGFNVGVKAKHDLGSGGSSMSFAGKWASPKSDHIWSGEVEANGTFKVAAVKKVESSPDTTLTAVYDFVPPQGREPAGSSLWLGFGREFLGGTRVRIALSSVLQAKAVLEGMIGRSAKGTYSVAYDPHKGMLKHGVTMEM
eukprot:TRINITY_DN19687_c0_g1_i1.p1 TRINITY_DN19687_c0_g1~~TRINITY_DN19687_c0_g1_i1.p1  ORF type:complete len:368 (+),score=129.82 TRINITY_DN19687_c0_g1_i1:76-1104(+)